MRSLYRLLSGWGDVRAARRGAGPYVRRRVRAGAHRSLARGLRRSKWLRP